MSFLLRLHSPPLCFISFILSISLFSSVTHVFPLTVHLPLFIPPLHLFPPSPSATSSPASPPTPPDSSAFLEDCECA